MPEIRELVSSYLHLVFLLQHFLFFVEADRLGPYVYRSVTNGWQLRAIWADATAAESKAAPTGSRQHRHLPFNIGVNDGTTRGGRKSNAAKRSRLWPHMFDSLDSLVLRNVYYTARSLVLDFGVCFLDMHYLTHTSLQLFTIEQWKESLLDIPATAAHRPYKIAIALEFPNYFLAFLSLDLVFLPVWTLTRPITPPEVFPSHDPHERPRNVPFLQWVVTWLEKNWTKFSRSRRLAIDVIRTERETFFGIGVYSACELFVLAGLWPGLLAREVFLNPSRLARLLEAIYVFTHIAKLDFLANVIRPALWKGNVLAPNPRQRKDFAAHFLRVWAKSTMAAHARFAALVDDFKSALADNTPRTADPFEPTFLLVAFERDIHLGHLIFGEDVWKASGRAPSAVMDPLTAFFKTKLWSILPAPEGFPEHDVQRRERDLFANVVDHTNTVAIGPIEFAGNPKPIPNGKTMFIPLHQSDPVILTGSAGYQFRRQLRAAIADKLGLSHNPGERKRARTEEEKARLDKAYAKELKKRGFADHEDIPVLSEVRDEAEGSSSSSSKVVRKRRNADLHMQDEAVVHMVKDMSQFSPLQAI
ncbi:hypothetical protein EXIGLDRAFT_700990 [Exidia glandulosa HHB12029]|uniref:Uncharacterized protein n=1 Tax=Exidia glandulosa HHB12029 TaxID=1314781 RepID=A0A165LXP2_EXIGL|nr:hypothetical protein EXIGLDRAFT_700990 [Exidia glandulosa HHB12029]